MLVKRQTSETADFFGLHDRGRLAPGLRADVNLIDFDALRLHKPELVHDMPANGRRFIQRVEGYEATLVAGTPEPIREMLNDPACLLGLSDGGAHCTSIIDAGVPSYMLTHWGRDRTRGPKLPLEMLVKRQTSETADFFGLSDRGRLAPGLRADVNLIDFDGMRHAEARADPRHAGERPALRAARHGLRGDACRGPADLRARRADRRIARQAGACGTYWRDLAGRLTRRFSP